jgi:hypothetical protein
MTDPDRHSLIEDAQGIAYGATMAAFGITLLTHLGLVTGQTAGLAVLIAYATGWSFGPVFFAVNLPFYILGYLRRNIAIIAHVDHGKTTMIDVLLKQSGSSGKTSASKSAPWTATISNASAASPSWPR